MKSGKFFVILFVCFLFAQLASAQTYDFVTCGQDGQYGPTQSECNSYYSGDNDVSVSGDGIQEWTVPQTGVYSITAYGPSGLNQNSGEAGEGAVVQGELSLNQGETIQMVIGQQSGYDGSRDWFGGSGGTFVVDSSDTPLLVAGAGAGHRTSSYRTEMRASTGTTAKDGKVGEGGSDANGGYGSYSYSNYVGGAGAGFSDNGKVSPDDRYDDTDPALSFLNGMRGGYHVGGDNLENNGGFGGGGSAGWGDAGGAGGYSGGGANGRGPADGWGGGGSSFIHQSISNAATSDGTFSTTGSEPHSTYSGGIQSLNNWNTGDGKVEITLITDPDDPVIQNINFDTSAGDPATIEGSFDVNIDDDGGNAPDNSLDGCTVTAEGTGNGGQVDLTTNIDGNTCSFSVNNNDHGNWNPDEELEFSMSVEDSYSGTDSLTRYRQFPVNPPNAPDQPDPADNTGSINTGTDLQVRATHPDNLDMEVRFFLDDGTGYRQVGSTQTVSDGSRPSVSPPELDPGSEYTWYAEASTQGRTTESTRWSFTTNYPPSVDSIDFEDSPEGHALNFSSVVSDQDGGGQISGGTLTVTDNEGNTETYNLNPESTDGNEATFTQQVSSQDNDQWGQVEDLNFDFEVEDDPGLSASETDSASLPNNEPVIESIETSEYSDRDAFEALALIKSDDSGSSEIRSCSIVIESSENSYSAGNMETVNSTHVRCIQEDIGPSTYPGLSIDESLQLTVRTTDIHGATSTRSIAYNAPTGVDYRYTSMIVPAGGVDFLPYQVGNDGEISTEYRVELRNVEASFTSNGQDTKTFELAPGTTQDMQIEVSPGSDLSGTEQLEVVTENTDTGVTETQTVDVTVRDAEGSTERTVPGIGLLQLLMIGLFATFVYGRSI